MKLIYWDGYPGSLPGLEPDELLVVDCDYDPRILKGWYWINDDLSDPIGPFNSQEEALKVMGSTLSRVGFEIRKYDDESNSNSC